jgi:hypothetical protein
MINYFFGETRFRWSILEGCRPIDDDCTSLCLLVWLYSELWPGLAWVIGLLLAFVGFPTDREGCCEEAADHSPRQWRDDVTMNVNPLFLRQWTIMVTDPKVRPSLEPIASWSRRIVRHSGGNASLRTAPRSDRR